MLFSYFYCFQASGLHCVWGQGRQADVIPQSHLYICAFCNMVCILKWFMLILWFQLLWKQWRSLYLEYTDCPFAVKSCLFFLHPVFVHWFDLCGRELWGRHSNPLLSCCILFRIAGMLMQRLRRDNVVSSDMPGEVTKREHEAATSRGMFDQPLFCKVAVCVLLIPAVSSQGNLYS